MTNSPWGTVAGCKKLVYIYIYIYIYIYVTVQLIIFSGVWDKNTASWLADWLSACFLEGRPASWLTWWLAMAGRLSASLDWHGNCSLVVGQLARAARWLLVHKPLVWTDRPICFLPGFLVFFVCCSFRGFAFFVVVQKWLCGEPKKGRKKNWKKQTKNWKIFERL